jgi:hypothetical protein
MLVRSYSRYAIAAATVAVMLLDIARAHASYALYALYVRLP